MEGRPNGRLDKVWLQREHRLFKSEQILVSDELQSLLQPEQEYLNLPTVPHYEAYTHFPVHWFVPVYPLEHLNYLCLVAFVYNS
jgi:hypothetical protein